MTINEARQSDSVRSSVVLPYSWDLPTDDEIASLARRLDFILTKTGNRRGIEGALLIAMTLQTAQRPTDLVGLQFRYRVELPPYEQIEAGIYITGKAGYIAHPRASPNQEKASQDIDSLSERSKKKKHNDDEAICVPVGQFIVLPLLSFVHGHLRKACENAVPGQSLPLFSENYDEVLKAANLILRRGRDWRFRTTKANRRVRAVASWLVHRLQAMEGGDPVFVQLLGKRHRGISDTQIHYVTLTHAAYLKAYRKAISITGKLAICEDPPVTDDMYIGSNRFPDWGKARAVIKSLQNKLNRPMVRIGTKDFDTDRHLAMMIYTFIVVSFATGQRGLTAPPALCDIDPETAFAAIVEKPTEKVDSDEPGEALRLVWHCSTAMKQLRAYEEYLDGLEAFFAKRLPSLSSQIQAARAQKRLAFFAFDHAAFRTLTPVELCKDSKRLGWKYRPNAGRHWYRSVLAGQVCPDVLSAQMGHTHGGLMPWTSNSALDPLQISIRMSRPIEQHLTDAGLIAWPSEPVRRKPYRRDWLPERIHGKAPAIKNTAAVLGCILASAIWNGALLNDALWDDAIAQMVKLAGDGSIKPQWLRLCRYSKLGQTHWYLEEGTCRILRLSPKFPNPNLLDLDSAHILVAWFGSVVAKDQFIVRAMRRWRARLPPILFQIAVGDAEIHVNKPILKRKVRGSFPYDGPGAPKPAGLLEPLLHHFEKAKSFSVSKKPRRHERRTRANIAKEEAKERLQGDRSWSELPTIARELLLVGADLFTRKQEGKGVPGLSASTIIDKLKIIDKILLATWIESHEPDFGIHDLDVEVLRHSILKAGPNAAGSVAQACRDIFGALRNSDHGEKLAHLNALVVNWRGNFTAMNVSSEHYQILLSEAAAGHEGGGMLPMDLCVALTLLYRTGVRADELWRLRCLDRARSGQQGKELLLDHEPHDRLKTFESRRRIPLDILIPAEELERLGGERFLNSVVGNVGRWERGVLTRRLDGMIKALPLDKVWNSWPFRHAFATNILSAILWPDNANDCLASSLDPVTFSRRQELKERLLPKNGAGVHSLQAVALLMGHTTPERTRFNYAHEQEKVLAAYVTRKGYDDEWMPKEWPIKLR